MSLVLSSQVVEYDEIHKKSQRRLPTDESKSVARNVGFLFCTFYPSPLLKRIMQANPKPFTVTGLTRNIKSLLERGFSSITLTGEISNLHRHSSGHIYLTLKDEQAQIAAVIWRSRAAMIRVEPADGLQVVVTGRLTVYEARGAYQIEINSIRAVGAGELAVLFEELKKKLGAEGLFDPARKRGLPLLPKSVGIVTSQTGAVLQDMVSIMTRRFPGIQIVLCPVRVQGIGAAVEIASAIRLLNQADPVDVIIVARGGGSLEDLWPFNEESVARAIFSSHIPVVSAVGHEVDFTIADFVADLRAPTPSAAAELVVPDRTVLLGNLRQNCYYLQGTISSMLKRHRNTIRNIVKSHSFNHPLTLLNQVNQRRDELERGILASVSHRIALQKSILSSLQKRVQLMNPDATLKRGYTLVYAGSDLVKTSTELERGDAIDIRFHDGTVRSTVG